MIRRAARVAVRLAARVVRRLSIALGRAERALLDRSEAARASRAEVSAAMRAHDMVDDPDEAYYRDRYLEWIAPRIQPALDGEVLDAGCGSGRLTIPLAQAASGHLTGVDFLVGSIEKARRHAAEAGVANVEFVESDLLEFLRGRPPGSYDAALFIEVGFVIPQLEDALRELARVLKPGGLLLGSFRSQWFLALLAAAQRDWAMAELVLAERSGALPGIGWQNWHAHDDLRELLRRTGFEAVSLQGVGAMSGIEGDPMESVARPSRLSTADREGLARLEAAIGSAQPDTGRYVLVEARVS